MEKRISPKIRFLFREIKTGGKKNRKIKLYKNAYLAYESGFFFAK